MKPGVDDRAYQIGVINSNKLKDLPVLETVEEKDVQAVSDNPLDGRN